MVTPEVSREATVADAPRTRNKRVGRRLAALTAACCLGAGFAAVDVADAAISSCATGSFGTGRVCLWTQSNYSGNPGWSSTSSVVSMNVGAKSRFNNITNRCVTYYRDGVAFAYGPPTTGWSYTTTFYTHAVDVSTC